MKSVFEECAIVSCPYELLSKKNIKRIVKAYRVAPPIVNIRRAVVVGQVSAAFAKGNTISFMVFF